MTESRIHKPSRLLMTIDDTVTTESFSRIFICNKAGYNDNPLEGRNPEYTLKRAVDLLNSCSLPHYKIPKWWVGVGTALGLSRDGGFIKGDTDIDIRIGLNYKEPEKALDVIEYIDALFSKEGFRLIREMYWEARPMQTAFEDTRNNDVIVDIYYFYTKHTFNSYVNYNPQGYRVKPAKFIRKLRKVPWPTDPTIIVNVPWPIEAYNEWRWGPEWRIPKKNSELTPDDLKCIRPLPVE